MMLLSVFLATLALVPYQRKVVEKAGGWRFGSLEGLEVWEVHDAAVPAEGYAKPQQLQGWLTAKVADYLASKGRRIAGWDEILAGDVPKSAIGQSWRTNPKNGVGTTW